MFAANVESGRSATLARGQFYRIQGSQNWQGQQYGAFQNYRGQWHNQNWWQSHYNRIVLINGGWYFRNANYWYRAWGLEFSLRLLPI